MRFKLLPYLTFFRGAFRRSTLFLFLAISSLSLQKAFGAACPTTGDIYWISTGLNNWNTANMWAATSGGVFCTGSPTNQNHVIFDGVARGSVTLNISVTVSSMTISTSTTGGYTGVFQFSASSLTVLNNFTINNGTFTQSSNALVVGGSYTNNGGLFNLTTGTMTFNGPNLNRSIRTRGYPFHNVDFRGAGSWVLTDSMTVTSTMTFTSGTLDTSASSFNLLVARNWNNIGGTFIANSSTVTFTGALAAQSIRSNGSAFGNLFLNAAGTWTLTDALSLNSSMTITGGTLNTSASNYPVTVGGSWWNTTGNFISNFSSVTFNGSNVGQRIRSNGRPFNNVGFAGSGYWTLVDSFTATSSMTFTGGTLDASSSNFGILVGRSWNNTAGTFVANASTVAFTGTIAGLQIRSNASPFGHVSFTGGANGYWTLQDSMTVTSTMTIVSGTLDTSGSNRNMSVGGTWMNSGGTFVANASTVSFSGANLGQRIRSNGKPFAFVDFPGVGYWTLVDSITTTGSLSLTAGTLDPSTSNFGVLVGVSWFNTGGAFMAQASTVTFNGTTSGLAVRSGGDPFSSVNFAGGSSAYWTMIDSMTLTSTMTITGGILDTSGSNQPIAVAGSWLNNGGNFVGNASTITFTGSNTAQRIRSNGRNFPNMNFTGSGFWTMQDSMTLTGTLSQSAGTLDPSASNFGIIVGDSWMHAGGTYVTRSSTITFNGGATDQQIDSSGNPLGSVVFNNAAGYWTLVDSMTVTSTMTLTAGTLDTSASNFGLAVGGSWLSTGGGFIARAGTVIFNATTPAQRIDPSGWPFNNVTFSGVGGFWTLIDSMTLTDTFTLAGGTVATNNLNMAIGGEWINTGGLFTVGTSSVAFTGSTLNERIVSRNSPFYMLTFPGSGSWRTATNPLTVTNNLTLSGGDLYVMTGGSLTVAGDMLVGTGSTFAIRENVAIQGGDLINHGTVTSISTHTLTLSGVGTLGGNGTTTLPRTTLSGGGQTTTLGGAIILQSSFTNSASHTLDVSASNYQITVSSDWVNNGNFTAQNGTVVFADDSRLSGSCTFYNLTAITPGITLTLPTNSTQTVTGALTLTGALGNLINIRSSVAGQANIRSIGTDSITYVDVQNSKASGNTLTAGSSTNSGNNTNWLFQTIRTWLGGTTAWGTASNWSPTGVPQNTDPVIFANTGNNPCSINVTANALSMTIQSGYTNTITGSQSLTVFGDMALADGTFNLGTSSVTVMGDWNNTGTTISGQGTVLFSTGANNVTITSAGEPFHNVNFIGSGVNGYWTLTDSMTVTSTMTMTSGTLDTSAGNLGIMVGRSWLNSGGLFLANASTVKFNGTTAGLQIRSNGKPFHNIELLGVGGYYTLVDSMTVVSTMTLTAGSLDTSGSNFGMIVGRSWNNTGGSFVPNVSTVTFNGTTTGLSIRSGGDPFGYLAFTGSGGYWTLQDSMTVTSSMTITAGTLDTGSNRNIAVAGGWVVTGGGFIANASTVSFTGSASGQRIDTSGWPFAFVSFPGSGYWTLADSMTVTQDLSLTAGTLDVSASNFGLVVGKSWNNTAGSFIARAGTTTLNGATAGLRIETNGNPFGYLNITGAGYWTLQDSMTVLSTMTIAAGTLDTGSNYNLAIGGDWLNTGGIFVANTSSVTFNGSGTNLRIISGDSPFYKLSITGSGRWRPVTDPLTVTNDVNVTNGILQVVMTSMTVLGNMYVGTSGTVNINTNLGVQGGTLANGGSITSFSTATLTLAGAGTLGGGGTSTLPRVTLNGAAQTTTLAGAVVLQGSFTINASHTLSASPGNYQITISSNWANNGTFTPTGGTVVFNATSTISGDTTFNNFTAATAGITLTFESGATQSVAGTLTLTGSSGNLIRIRSTAAGQAFLDSSGTAAITYVDVQNSNASGNTLNATQSTNSGGNTNWTFSTQRTWVGATANWNVATNWSPNGVPSSDDPVIFAASGNNACTINVAATVSSMTVQVGYTRTITANFPLTIAGDVSLASGTYSLNATTITVGGAWDNTGMAINPGSGVVLFTADVPGITIRTGNKFFGTVTINSSGGAGYFTLLDSMTVTQNLLLMSGTLDTSGSNFGIAVGRSWLNTGGTFVDNVSTVTFNGTVAGLGIRSGASPFAHVNFAGTGATWTLQDPLVVDSTMTITAGTLNTSTSNHSISVGGSWMNTGGLFVVNASSVAFTGANAGQRIRSNGRPFMDVNFSGNGYWTLVDSMTVSSTMTLTAGTLDTAASNQHILIGRSWDNEGGAFVANGSTVTFAGTIGGLSIQSGGMPFSYVAFVGGANGYWTLVDSMTLTSTMTITSGTLDTGPNQNISVGGSWWNNGGTFIANVSTVTFTGTPIVGLRIRSNGKPFSTINLAGVGYWTLVDSITVTGDLALTAGTLDTSASNFGVMVGENWLNTAGAFVAQGSTVTFNGTTTGLTIRSGGDPFNHVHFRGSGGYWTLIDSMTVSSTMTFTAGTLDTSGSNFNILVGGSWWNFGGTSGFVANASTVTLTAASGVQRIDSSGWPFGYLALTGAASFTLVDSMTVTHSLSLAAGSLATANFNIAVGREWLNTGTTFTVGTSSVAFTGSASGNRIVSRNAPFNLVSFPGSGSWTTATNPVTVTSNLNLNGADFTVASGATLTVVGDFWVGTGSQLTISTDTIIQGGDLTNGGTITSTPNARLTLSGAGVLGGAGTTTLPRVTLSGGGQTTTLGGDIVLQGSFTILASHTLDASGSGYQITISSDWANNGTFTPQTGAVIFNSTATISGATTFNDFTATTAGITLTFISNSTQTINGVLTITGSSGNRIRLQASGATNFYLQPMGTITVSQVHVTRSTARNQPIYAGQSSFNGGNNINWFFDYLPAAIADLAASALSNGQIRLTWTAPLDNDDNPLAAGSAFAIQYSTWAVTPGTGTADTGVTFTSHVFVSTSGINAGDSLNMNIPGLTGSVAYNFWIWTRDPLLNWSPVSNTANATVVTVVSVSFGQPSYNFGSVAVGATTISTSAVTIVNGGNVTQTYTLFASTAVAATPWTLKTALPTTLDTFVLSGVFNATQPNATAYGVEDVILSTATTSTGTRFTTGSQTGVSTPAGFVSSLWLKLDMPLLTTTTNQQHMDITVTAATP